VLRFGRLRATLALTWALCFAMGCPGEDEDTTIQITSPTTGTLSLADDTDPGTDGLQIAVDATSMGLDVGTAVNLFLDAAMVDASTIEDGGAIGFTGVTIPGGTHTLVIETAEGGIRSNEVVVTVTDACFAVSFVDPMPTTGTIRLGPGDDTDGEACGATFEISVVIATAAPDGATAQLFVNGTPQAMAPVAAGQARFDGVQLGNRDPMENLLRVAVTDSAGLSCDADLSSPILVECAEPSCTITAPSTDTAFLNASDDVSAADGFQTNFAVGTDEATTARLIIDGDESGAPSAMFAMGTAMFGNVTLEEGLHRVVAECIDEVGNTVRSPPAEWTVDTMGCGVTIESPTAGTAYIDADDVDPGAMGVQVPMTGTAGADCSGLRVGPCATLDTASFDGVTADWMANATLATSAMQDLCAQTTDEAGNVSEATVMVRFQSEAPMLQIESPADDTRINKASDAVPGDDLCESDFVVLCDAPGEDVELYRADTTTLLDTAPCVADATAPAPYSGRATFPEVTLPNLWAGYPVDARTSFGPLPGMATPITIFSDCQAPELLILRPMCGGNLNPNSQDEQPDPGFQYETRVSNSDPSTDVTLEIGPAGGAPTYTAMTSVVGPAAVFPDADYSAGGTLRVTATATDPAGNVGTSTPDPCEVTIEDLPTVMITRPTMGDVLTSADDCDGGSPGMQVRVRGTSDAPGGDVTITITSSTSSQTTTGTVTPGGDINVCADSPEGPVTIRVEVTDPMRGTGQGTLTVTVDTLPPTSTIGPLTTTVVDRRGGFVRFEWTAVADAGSPPTALSSYDLRCSSESISSEADWNDATAFTITTTPGAPGALESEEIGGFRVGEQLECVLRGADATGALTPIGPGATIDLSFLTHTVDGVMSTGFGEVVAGAGDVNSDGVPDVLAGGSMNTAYLFYGSPVGVLATVPSVTFRSSTAGLLGLAVAGIGDLNADGMQDFAISAPGSSSNSGQVFVFFGRTVPLPADCDIDLPTCAPDLTFNGPTGLALLGRQMSSGDFDGDGTADLILSASGVSMFSGNVFVIRGGSHLTSGSSFTLEAGSGSEPDAFRIIAPSGFRAFGNNVAGMGGSMDADSRHEIAIVAAGGTMTGLFLVRGQAYTGPGLQTVPGSAVETIATAGGDRFIGVASACDQNGDGLLDVTVYNASGGSSGNLTTYLGSGTAFDTSSVINTNNDYTDAPGDEFGLSFADCMQSGFGAFGDIDGDGRGDVFAGSTDAGTGPGDATLFYGDATTTRRRRSEATPVFDGTVGASKASFIGDIDGDGYFDMAIGRPEENSGAGQLIIVY